MVKDRTKVAKKPTRKTPAPCPISTKTTKKKIKKEKKKTGLKANPLIFGRKKKSNAIGVGVRPKRDLRKYVKWPKYIRIQRKKKILMQRLKVPPSINQFSHTLPKDQKIDLLNFLSAYKPETKAAKKERLLKKAQNALNKIVVKEKKPLFIKCGINHVTELIERKKAKLVVIANDVNPIELVLYIPSLCRIKDIPYCIIHGKSDLGKLVNLKTATAICLDAVSKEDQKKLEYFTTLCREQFNNNVEIRRKWGGHKMSAKSIQQQKIKDKAQKLEEAKKKEITAKL